MKSENIQSPPETEIFFFEDIFIDPMQEERSVTADAIGAWRYGTSPLYITSIYNTEHKELKMFPK